MSLCGSHPLKINLVASISHQTVEEMLTCILLGIHIFKEFIWLHVMKGDKNIKIESKQYGPNYTIYSKLGIIS